MGRHTRRPAHPHAVSSFTRLQRKDKDMHPEPHVYMDEEYHRATRKYNASKRAIKAHGKTGGRRRRRGSRYTRRR